MHKTITEARALARELVGRAAEFVECQVVLCPPFTSIQAVAESVARSGIEVGAQDAYWENKGAYTGEVSCEMLIDAGCRWVIIGHSERRAMFGETDVDKVLAECEACRQANPDNHVRLIGYNNFTQSQGASMVIFRGKTV